tara:strand:- start:1090 stop:1509 length:420 start_codon:yes stop_codon:yes gene_type:complete
MKSFVMFALVFNIVRSQDTLSILDSKSVRDPAPNTPKVLDKIFGITEISILDSIKNSRLKTKSGFRLQIFESSSVEEANRLLNKNRKILTDSLYLIFEAPLYKLKYGNYINKTDAENAKKQLLRKGYKNIWIVRSRIHF